jgi:hypothetical protein
MNTVHNTVTTLCAMNPTKSSKNKDKSTLINILLKQEKEMMNLKIKLLNLQRKLTVLSGHTTKTKEQSTYYDYSNNSLRHDQLNHS